MSKLQSQTNEDTIREKKIIFLREMLDEKELELEQLDDSFDNTVGNQQKRLSVLENVSKIKEIISGLSEAIKFVKTQIFFRNSNIPKSIPDEHVWNDCWYDKTRKAYITFNEYFYEIPNARTRDIQKKYEQELITNLWIVLEEEKIQFRFGYPSILQKDVKGNPIWYSYATLYDEMLTSGIVKGKIQPENQNKAYYYTVGSEAWISVLGRYLTEKEYMFAQEFMPFMSKTPIEVLKATSGKSYDSKLYQKQLKQMNKETKQWEKDQKKKKQ
jgi:hypothetical protein